MNTVSLHFQRNSMALGFTSFWLAVSDLGLNLNLFERLSILEFPSIFGAKAI